MGLVEYLVQHLNFQILPSCRFAIDTMQSICLDEFGGEKAVPPRSQETTLIQHIFGGHLQSQVMKLIGLNLHFTCSSLNLQYYSFCQLVSFLDPFSSFLSL